jgi:hypothetical protein
MKFGGSPVAALKPHTFVVDPSGMHGAGGVPNDFSCLASALPGAKASRKTTAVAIAPKIPRARVTVPEREPQPPKLWVTRALYADLGGRHNLCDKS